jgi:hypothetical protein
MLKKSAILALLAFAFLVLRAPGLSAQDSGSAPPVATPENAAWFVGDWDIATDNAGFALSVKSDSGKLVADLTGQQGTQHVTNVTLSGKSLVLKYTFDYQGTPVPTVVTLTPKGENLDVNMDFGGGAFAMGGTGKKKSAHS